MQEAAAAECSTGVSAAVWTTEDVCVLGTECPLV